MRIDQLLDKVESEAIVLPEFQREFVWNLDQSKELINSLFKGYPIGSILIWETEEPPAIKNEAVDRDQYATVQVLLDGQQRLTVLYLLLKDDVPPYYKPEEIHKDPRKLYFNLNKGGFHYENKVVRKNPEQVKVTKIFNSDISPTAIAREKCSPESDDSERFRLSQMYEKNLMKLKDIRTNNIPDETLPKSANIHQGIDLFDRVNSRGTRLRESQLALAHMTAQWPDIRRVMKEKQNNMKDKGFDFPLPFYVKCMLAVVTGGMEYKDIHNVPRETLQKYWKQLAKEHGDMDVVIKILSNEAYIPESDYINTRDALIPFIFFVNRNDGKITRKEKNHFIRWFYLSLIWRRYTGSSDTTLEKDLSLIGGEPPTRGLIKEIESQRGRLEIEASDLEGKGKVSKYFYNMVRILTRANDPVDWLTGEPLRGSFDLHSHHIFPKSKLYDTYDPKEDSQMVNEVANRAFLTPDANNQLQDRLPEDYLQEVKAKDSSSLISQFIPDNPNLWKIENYETFLAKRRELLAEKINEHVKSFIREGGVDNERSIHDLLKQGENKHIEFKETLLWDVHQQRANKELKTEVAKEISAFANSEGGVLIIGVDDREKTIKGLTRDFKLMEKGQDSFGLELNQEVSNKLGDKFPALFMTTEFPKIEKKKICKVSVETSPEPVYFQGSNSDEFYIRSGSSKRALNHQETTDYIKEHWG